MQNNNCCDEKEYTNCSYNHTYDYDLDYDDLHCMEEDYEHVCEMCGEIMTRVVEHGEAWGAPYSHESWECNNCGASYSN